MKAKYFFKGLAAITLLGLPMLASAQDYDDDIYYNASKSKKTTTKKTTQQTYASQTDYADYAAADTYYYNSGSTRDIDEYNRRGAYAVDTTAVSADSTAVGEFGYTRRIERFHNPDVVVNSGDADLIDYYYSTDASSNTGTTVNVYVYDTPYYYGSWRSPYYRFSRWGWYDPWYWDIFSPAWSLGWGWYDPWYSWSWGWGPSFGWGGLGWGHSWCGHGWGGHGWGGGMAMRPVTPNAGRAHANVGSSMNSVRRASAGTSLSGQARPGSLSARRFGSSSSLSSSRNNNGNSSVQSTTTGRGRFGSSNSSNSSSNSSRRSNSYNNSNNSYNSSSSSSSRGSGSSFGGSRGGGSSYGGGGGNSGGGGGGRGRR